MGFLNLSCLLSLCILKVHLHSFSIVNEMHMSTFSRNVWVTEPFPHVVSDDGDLVHCNEDDWKCCLRKIINEFHLKGKVSNKIQMASPRPLLNFYFYVYGCFTWVYVCMYVWLVPSGAHRDQRASDPWWLELEMVVCCHVGAGNQSPVLWKNSKSSRLLSHLSSPFLLSVTLAY